MTLNPTTQNGRKCQNSVWAHYILTWILSMLRKSSSESMKTHPSPVFIQIQWIYHYLICGSHNPAESLENKTDNSVCVTERENSDKGVRKADLYMCVLSVSVFILTSFCLSKTWCWLDWSLIFYIRTTTVLIKAIIFQCKCCELATFTLSEWT